MTGEEHARVLRHYREAFRDAVDRVQSHCQDLRDMAHEGDAVTAAHLADLESFIAALKDVDPANLVPPIPEPDPPQRLKNRGRP
jgi:hypothetical protein